MVRPILHASLLPVIAGVEITTDAEGRFNLNALHKASGADKKNGPSYWLSLDGTKSLIDELKNQTTEIPVVTKEGRGGGTFANEIIAVSYAAWISPAFQIKVNQVFLDYRTGKLQPAQQVDPMSVLNDPAAMRGLLLNYLEEVIALIIEYPLTTQLNDPSNDPLEPAPHKALSGEYDPSNDPLNDPSNDQFGI